jgi:hypothetical protein
MNIINDTELFNIGITGLEGVFTDLSGTVIFSKEGKQWIEDFRNNLNYKNKQFYLTSKDVLTAKSNKNYRKRILSEKQLKVAIILPEKFLEKSQKKVSLFVSSDDIKAQNEKILLINSGEFVNTLRGKVVGPDFKSLYRLASICNDWIDESCYYENIIPYWGSVSRDSIEKNNYLLSLMEYFDTPHCESLGYDYWFEIQISMGSGYLDWLLLGQDHAARLNYKCHKCGYEHALKGCDCGIKYIENKKQFGEAICDACEHSENNNGIYNLNCEYCGGQISGRFLDIKANLKSLYKYDTVRFCNNCREAFFGRFSSSNKALEYLITKILNHKDSSEKISFATGYDVDRVRVLSEINYKKFKKEINPKNYSIGGKYHIDHIVPVSIGAFYNIPVELIAAPENLRVLDATINMKKGDFFDPKQMVDIPDDITRTLDGFIMPHENRARYAENFDDTQRHHD